MANSTILALVQQAAGEMGLSVPGTVVGNPTQDVLQLRYLIQAVGNELNRERDWQTLITEYRFPLVFYTYTGTTTNGSTSVTAMSSTTGLTSTPTYFMVTGTGIPQDTYLTAAGGGTVTLSNAATASGTTVSLTFSQTKYPYPSDYDRPIDSTQWDKSKHWEMLGPLTQQQAQWLKSGYISTGPRLRFYPEGGFFQIWPPIGTNDQIGFSYVSKNWILAAADVVTPSKLAYSVDTDTCIYPDVLMVLGLKSKYFTAKGWNDVYGNQFMQQKSIAMANDSGSATLSMAPRLSQILINWTNIPDSGYGS
jgi:hypothetical protein